MGYKTNPARKDVVGGGCKHNPAPTTPRGKRRAAANEAKKAAGGTAPAAKA